MIRKALVLTLVVVACAAWFASSELPELGKGDTGAATVGAAGYPSGRAGVSAARPRTFATLPDRGNLVSYPTPSPARVDGAYSWHRAEISEEHAFRSLQTRTLRITSPSGKPLEFEYSRHVEHSSGDWTWIGRLRGGKRADEAVITFGERAVFGSIADPGKTPLRLTTMQGVGWLVETDAAKVAAIRNEATRPTKPDYLVPPEPVAGPTMEASDSTSGMLVPPTAAATSAAAGTTVDVVVGYTSGFAASLGGQSQAVTRLNNMVEIANQAYVNSQVDAEIRMVHSLQVEYPDNTTNRAALESLTGYRSGAGQIPVDPAFAALRAARDQYGGDLVTLVRKFQTPENDGCGIAWLIGGGRTGLDAGDAPFGYSVVSDGVDTGTDGKNYFCRPETLAHELGHNMGSQHDRATATENGSLNYGVFTYSFGYKTDTENGNFYTVMAYGDTGQNPYRVFSNPRTTFCGLPCGIVDQADNSRSLAQTIPVVAGFRGSVIIDGELIPPVTVGDFNGDRLSDAVLEGAYPDIPILTKGPEQRFIVSMIPRPPGWRLVGSGDVDADGRSDLFWHNPSTGALDYWLMAGSTVRAFVAGGALPGYSVRVIRDFNADGRADVLWSNGSDLRMWIKNAASGFTSSPVLYAGGWTMIGAGDFDLDGKADLLWQNFSTGAVDYWLMDGPQVRAFVAGGSLPAGYTLGAIADFNGDSRADIVWSNGVSEVRMWTKLPSAGFSSARVSGYPGGWTLTGAGDVDGDGLADLFWHNPGSGALDYWLMNGPGIVAFRIAAGYML